MTAKLKKVLSRVLKAFFSLYIQFINMYFMKTIADFFQFFFSLDWRFEVEVSDSIYFSHVLKIDKALHSLVMTEVSSECYLPPQRYVHCAFRPHGNHSFMIVSRIVIPFEVNADNKWNVLFFVYLFIIK